MDATRVRVRSGDETDLRPRLETGDDGTQVRGRPVLCPSVEPVVDWYRCRGNRGQGRSVWLTSRTKVGAVPRVAAGEGKRVDPTLS